MSDQRNLAARVIDELEAHVRRLRPRNRSGCPQIIPYRGHGTSNVAYLKGRVLVDEAVPRGTARDAVWRNLLHTLRRIDSNEVPGARVRAWFGGAVQDAIADDEGFFDLRLEPARPLETGRLWHPAELELLHPAGEAPVRAKARVLIPPPHARFGVISDIDDTVIRTDATNLLRMARMVLLTNAHTRLPFEGVAAFYRALQAGPAGEGANPVFYVSSSPWNFYDLLEEVFEVHGIPAGPLFLKDYDLSREVLLAVGHHRHKLAAIRALLETHPTLSWVLVGDSGQQDPEIYRQVVREYPERIRAIYIRDVTSEQRDRQVRAIAEEVRAVGVEMVPVADTVAAAEHATRQGLIHSDTLPEVRAERASDKAAPDALESVIS